jgi:hypothetical protein
MQSFSCWLSPLSSNFLHLVIQFFPSRHPTFYISSSHGLTVGSCGHTDPLLSQRMTVYREPQDAKIKTCHPRMRVSATRGSRIIQIKVTTFFVIFEPLLSGVALRSRRCGMSEDGKARRSSMSQSVYALCASPGHRLLHFDSIAPKRKRRRMDSQPFGLRMTNL